MNFLYHILLSVPKGCFRDHGRYCKIVDDDMSAMHLSNSTGTPTTFFLPRQSCMLPEDNSNADNGACYIRTIAGIVIPSACRDRRDP
jgi:hypothetical protein